MQGWLSILIMIALGAGFGLGSIVLSQPARPAQADAPRRSAPYECGMPPVGDARERQSVKFYLVAMIFLLFDIEVAFLYPWAMALRDPRLDRLRAGRAVHAAPARRLRLRLAQGRARLGQREARYDRAYEYRNRHSRADDDRREDGAVGAPLVDLAGHLRPRLLRDRDDVDELLALRHRALRRRGVPRQPAPVRPDDRGRPAVAQDGAGAPPHLRPDARAEVGDLDGRLRVDRRRVRQLRASCRASIRSCRSTCTCPAARRGPNRSSTASSSSSGRSRSRSSRDGSRPRSIASLQDAVPGADARGRAGRRLCTTDDRTCRATTCRALARALRDARSRASTSSPS